MWKGVVINMKKPKYMEDVMKIIFFTIGFEFICFCVFSYIDVPNPDLFETVKIPSLMDIIFGVVGITFILGGIVLSLISVRKSKKCANILENGIRINGVVEKISLQRHTQLGNQTPYVIQYRYTFRDKEYHRKSFYIWEKPCYEVGDTIVLYVDDFGKSAVS